MSKFDELKYLWYSARSSIISTIPIDEHQRSYYSRGSLASVSLKKLSQLEDEWLGLITASASLPTYRRASDLWSAAVGLYSGAAVSPIKNENEYLFYSTVTVGTLK